ncbi:AMP-binding protein, partial [Rheinheimera gaetbuli]
MIEHKNVVAFLCWAKKEYTIQQLSLVLASTSICFDLSVFELFAPLTSGGAALIVKNILQWNSCEQALKISLINTVPSAIESLLINNSLLPGHVKTINLAGEFLKQSLVERLYASGVEQVYDLYGPSEDTTYSTRCLRKPGGISSIGRGIHNTQLFILNACLELVLEGVCGELYIGGDGLARGYLNNDSLTTERFIANPFYDPNRAGSSKRIYKTGDLVRWLPDGNLAYLGRIDHQVKLRGFRVELGEIERCLAAQEYVQEAVVLSKVSERGITQLVAYVSIGKENGLRADDKTGRDWNAILGQYSRQYLPDYMIPSVFVVLESMPLTPNG